MPSNSPRYLGGALGVKALLAAFDISDLFKAIVDALLRLKRGRALLKEGQGESLNQVPLEKTQEVNLALEYPIQHSYTNA